MDEYTPTRRDAIRVGGTAVFAGLAGCTGGTSDKTQADLWHPSELESGSKKLAISAEVERRGWDGHNEEVLSDLFNKFSVPSDEGTLVYPTTEQTELFYDSIRIKEDPFLESAYFYGIYRGDGFTWGYKEETSTKMRMFPRIVPSDRILDVYMVGAIRNPSTNPELVVDIYADDDFRKSIEPINIAWGTEWTDNFRQFSPNEIEPVIFRDTITDKDVTRFKDSGEGHEGEANIMIGDFSQSDIENQNIGDSTIVSLK